MVGALSTSQIAALETSDLRQLSTANIAALTTTQISALTALQVCALSTTQLGALSTTQIGSMSLSSPIILDLNGDGISTLSVQNGTRFDLSADGSSVQTGWVAPSDGLLVLDRNQDGVINDGSELFGTSTALQNGSKAIDGYQALSEMDSNKDGVINSQDTSFSKLGVWIDSDSDGKTGNYELKSLTDLNITQLNLEAQITRDSNQGNLIGLTSSYQTADGSSHAAADVWFVVDKASVVNTQSINSVSTSELNLSNKLVKAIDEFNKIDLFVPRLDISLEGYSSIQAAEITEGVIKLTTALSEYRANTVNAALASISDLGSKSEKNNLFLSVDVRNSEDKKTDFKNLLISNTYKS
jgi:hypothetical protein